MVPWEAFAGDVSCSVAKCSVNLLCEGGVVAVPVDPEDSVDMLSFSAELGLVICSAARSDDEV